MVNDADRALQRPPIQVAAPGKAILCGEYAVLYGAPAVSVAVDRYVIAAPADADRPAEDPPSPFVAEARRCSGAPPVVLDSRALYVGDRKIGIGSSAAVTVATVGLGLALSGQPGQPLDDRDRLFALSEEAHARAQGTRGSGIDVATSVWGGVLRFTRRTESADTGVVAMPVSWPADLRLTFVFTGYSASTGRLLEAVHRLRAQDPAAHDRSIQSLTDIARRFDAALAEGQLDPLLSSVDAYHTAMDSLGRACGADIVTPELSRLAELARSVGGAAKPSGAGGGDLGVAFTVGDQATGHLRRSLTAAGLAVLDMQAGAPGVHARVGDVA